MILRFIKFIIFSWEVWTAVLMKIYKLLLWYDKRLEYYVKQRLHHYQWEMKMYLDKDCLCSLVVIFFVCPNAVHEQRICKEMSLWLPTGHSINTTSYAMLMTEAERWLRLPFNSTVHCLTFSTETAEEGGLLIPKVTITHHSCSSLLCVSTLHLKLHILSSLLNNYSTHGTQNILIPINHAPRSLYCIRLL